jgi:hypothetical protein
MLPCSEQRQDFPDEGVLINTPILPLINYSSSLATSDRPAATRYLQQCLNLPTLCHWFDAQNTIESAMYFP